MYWIIEQYGGLAVAIGGSLAPIGWIVAIGLGLVLAYSCVLAWRRRGESDVRTRSVSPPQRRVPTEPFVTDEERVLDLLESNGGRMRQSRIVEATDWSKSKVSMLLSEMEGEGLITKLRVGRENIISRPGFEPDAAGSPLETGA